VLESGSVAGTDVSAPVVTEVRPSAFAGLIGVGRRDTTPPHGIYARMWGAASHDQARGTHRPLTATALALRDRDGGPTKLLVALDLAMLGDIGNPSDGERVLAPVRAALELGPGQLIVNCSHTHSAPWSATSRSHLPGGDLLAGYLDAMGSAIREAGREAVARLAPATLTWTSGRCDLATNRDLPDPAPGADRVICGYNPGVAADDTLVVGRITADQDGAVLATIVNYACHPTTLAWDNTLISPDFIGGMRELVERHTGGAPCLFLQGASGELSPAHQYVGDPEVADRHGRRLGFSALAALEGMLPPGHGLAYEGVVESGAPLAVWLPRAFAPSGTLAGAAVDVALPVKPLPSLTELEAQLAATDDRVTGERLFRKSQIVRSLGGDGAHVAPAWVWRLGDSLLVAHPNEAYSRFQKDLRRAFPGRAVAVLNTSGPELGYIHPPELEGLDLYQVWQSPFAAEALERLTEACIAEGRRLLADEPAAAAGSPG
jgi:hypothetical protein